MKKTVTNPKKHLDNWIPITGDDTRRRSNARTPRQSGRAYQGSENAVQVKQGRRAGTGTVRGREQRKGEETYIVPTKRKTAELLQQSSGAPRFGKRRLHLQTV